MCRWFVQQEFHTEAWYHRNVVWVDPCASILPGSHKQWLKQKQVLKRGKRWVSDDALGDSRNLPEPDTALKQRSWEGRKVNWVIILARGQIGVDILPEDWVLDGEGMAMVIRRLTGRLRDMLGAEARLPRVLMTDRGTGMYAPSGQAVRAFENAAAMNKFRLLWGSDAKQQAPDMPDLLLHETAVSWLRNVLRRTKPECPPWKESLVQWSRRMLQAVAETNLMHDVESLCNQFPSRVDDCLAADGERIPH